jgi:excisionase family DNA binding protein
MEARMNEHEWMTAEQVADMLGVHLRTIYRWIKEGRLEAKRLAGGKIFRIHRDSAEKMLA